MRNARYFPLSILVPAHRKPFTNLSMYPSNLSIPVDTHVHKKKKKRFFQKWSTVKFVLQFIFIWCLKIYQNINTHLWLVWLSGLKASLQTKGLPVQFPVRAHAWVVGQVPTGGDRRGTHTLMFLSLSTSFPLSLKIKSFFFKVLTQTYHFYFLYSVPQYYIL